MKRAFSPALAVSALFLTKGCHEQVHQAVVGGRSGLRACGFLRCYNALGCSGGVGHYREGYLSASYSTNFNDGNQLGGRTFDGTTDSFAFNQAALTVSKLPTEGFGALVNVIAGNDATVINGSYGDGDSKFNLTQAYVQYAVGGLTVIGGRYVTLSGFEVINETATPHIAHGYLFQNAEPLVHTGLRASYKFNDTITAYLGLNNSAIGGAATDNNKLKTIESGVALTPIKPLSIGLYNSMASTRSLAKMWRRTCSISSSLTR